MIGFTCTTCWSVRRIELFIAQGDEVFRASEVLQDAVIRNLEVIGEAAKHVSMETREQLPDLEWRAICGIRDVLIHNYIGVDLEEVWNVASTNIPDLRATLARFLEAADG